MNDEFLQIRIGFAIIAPLAARLRKLFQERIRLKLSVDA